MASNCSPVLTTLEGSSETAAFLTNTEAYFKDGLLIIRAELAGVDPKSVDVSVAGRKLTNQGGAQEAGGSDG